MFVEKYSAFTIWSVAIIFINRERRNKADNWNAFYAFTFCSIICAWKRKPPQGIWLLDDVGKTEYF